MPGPVPKRASQRRRRNVTEPTTTVAVQGDVAVPPLDLEDVHTLARSMYEALARSGQARYFEPSDWQYARWAAFVQSKALQQPTAALVMVVDKLLSNLLVTEADRRRVRMEINRTSPGESGEEVSSTATGIAERRRRLCVADGTGA